MAHGPSGDLILHTPLSLKVPTLPLIICYGHERNEGGWKKSGEQKLRDRDIHFFQYNSTIRNILKSVV